MTGGGSWLAHAAFLSGLWISGEQRFRTLTSSDRTTLTGAFRATGAWRTVGVAPGVDRAWPEGRFFGLDHVYDRARLGYRGPAFGWSQVPDQFTLEAFRRLESGRRGRGPLMAQIMLTSSHHPWAPVPRMTDWRSLGDGSVFHRVRKDGTDAEALERISGWGWTEGLKPAADAPVRAMDAFRDRFLRAYGPRPG